MSSHASVCPNCGQSIEAEEDNLREFADALFRPRQSEVDMAKQLGLIYEERQKGKKA